MAKGEKLTGALFVNERKDPDSKQPDYTGNITDSAGKEWRLAGWKRATEAGKVWLSLKISDPMAQKPAAKPDFDDPVPF